MRPRRATALRPLPASLSDDDVSPRGQRGKEEPPPGRGLRTAGFWLWLLALDLIHHPQHVEVVVLLVDAVALEREHLGGLDRHPVARGGGLFSLGAERALLGGLPPRPRRHCVVPRRRARHRAPGVRGG